MCCNPSCSPEGYYPLVQESHGFIRGEDVNGHTCSDACECAGEGSEERECLNRL